LRVAAIDIGTNTVLLLVVEKKAGGEVVALADRAEITRLGQGVDRARSLSREAVERTLACLERYAGEIRRLGVDALDVVGTSAMRDAAGAGSEGAGFVRRAEEILGVAPRVVSGEEEAALTFTGGLHGLGLSGRVAAFDVGGGSTEVITGTIDGAIPHVATRISLDVGSVRLFERHVRHDPPSAAELSAVRAAVEGELAAVGQPEKDRPLVGMAGTVTTLAAIARGIDPYDGMRVHGMRLAAAEIDECAGRLAALPLAERKGVPGLEPKRADVIPVGAVIVQAVLAWAGAGELIVSDRGVRWGAALALLSPPAQAE
jgi:exopolyphosphatase / guanosine-5'-triphosphate,3'-diphosphate pyrophosphatase